jgi:hypothetical protein
LISQPGVDQAIQLFVHCRDQLPVRGNDAVVEVSALGVGDDVADAADLGRHAADPGEVGVVEHVRVLYVLAGVEHRARRGAHAGVNAVVEERRAALRQPLVRRQPAAAGAKESRLSCLSP